MNAQAQASDWCNTLQAKLQGANFKTNGSEQINLEVFL
jgi:hypothetical protein